MNAGTAPQNAGAAHSALQAHVSGTHAGSNAFSRRDIPAREGAKSARGAGLRRLSQMLKGLVLGVLFALSSALVAPSSYANAVQSHTHSHERDHRPQSKAGKKLVIVG